MLTKNDEKTLKEDVKEFFGKFDLTQEYKVSNAEIERRQKKELIHYKNDSDGNPIYLTKKQIRKMESGMK